MSSMSRVCHQGTVLYPLHCGTHILDPERGARCILLYSLHSYKRTEAVRRQDLPRRVRNRSREARGDSLGTIRVRRQSVEPTSVHHQSHRRQAARRRHVYSLVENPLSTIRRAPTPLSGYAWGGSSVAQEPPEHSPIPALEPYVGHSLGEGALIYLDHDHSNS